MDTAMYDQTYSINVGKYIKQLTNLCATNLQEIDKGWGDADLIGLISKIKLDKLEHSNRRRPVGV